MDFELLSSVLDSQQVADELLPNWGIRDARRGRENLRLMQQLGVPLDLLSEMSVQLAAHLPACSDADMALNNLEMFVAHARNPLSLAALFERDPTALPELLKIFSTSQYLAGILIHDSGSYDLLRLTEGRPIAREVLIDELCAETASLDDSTDIMRALRRFKRRETLRISYGDLILDQHLNVVTEQISYVADALLEAAFRAAARRMGRKLFGTSADLASSRDFYPPMAILALGKLGGRELNYSSDIDLIYVYDDRVATSEKRPLNQPFFERLAQETTKLLAESTELGQVYRVDLRLRPDGTQSSIAPSIADALRYYDLKGRTWERQAYVKARVAAGDVSAGNRLLNELQPWVYQRYLAAPDIAGVKALKRRIERRSHQDGVSNRDVKTGHGGIRDIEFCVQFLQLLNGGEQSVVRTGNTLDAIHRLGEAGCLTDQERGLLEENYRFLRRIEHRLQLLFDLQTHELPQSESELRKLAIRMGFSGEHALTEFREQLSRTTKLNRRILDHLLHESFGQDDGVAPETDLILDPSPEETAVHEILAPYGFHDTTLAYKNLMELAEEKIRFLSTRRCRHFLASVAPALLDAIRQTPDPDGTLTNLDRVTNSLGGKATLWELFNANPAAMRLCVELCSISGFLTGVLISQPGMLDELMDSLMLDTLPTRQEMDTSLHELCRGAEDIDPILHSFRNSYLLRIGARDILGKEDLIATTSALTDLAECVVSVVAKNEYDRLVAKFGEPRFSSSLDAEDVNSEDEQDGKNAATLEQTSRWAILALGKFGGRELTYHSDLDLVFIYEADGKTTGSGRGEPTTNSHFFSELASRITKAISHLGPWGRLYEVDARLRPTGRSGALATALEEFTRYFETSQGQLWERQAMCKARPVYVSPSFGEAVQQAIGHAVYQRDLTDEDVAEICSMRRRLENNLSFGNIKRGPGGVADHEFLAQMLRLRHVQATDETTNADMRSPTTLVALAAMHTAGHISDDDWRALEESYLFLRKVQLRHRLMSSVTRDGLPDAPQELRKLAHYMGFQSADEFTVTCHEHLKRTRKTFDKYVRT
ncbi:MAG: bifunctional [glutamate--ammonia ligase]-adenylyl-L-tyrosine phosphorylase/[glutamate--ammonia-ligase] adenylyltransferase [Pirellulales bacterium]|nr:bifunctional [glutamate--ammonia ligase]-adenylyl-L-tyrosine phosphorylase/[glutamate--ammonia-ligase] adenylyltransferase [Pirellulales bacterium]